MIDADIEKLAAHVAKIAGTEGSGAPPFCEKIDALKTLTSYYAILSRNRRNGGDDPDGANFDRFAEQIKEAENGAATTQVRGGRGTGHDA